MSKKKQINPKDFQKRILELESIYGTAGLGDRLGVSRDSIRRYRSGKTTPQDKKIYSKVNRIYGQKKKEIIPERVEQIKQRQVKQSKSQKLGRLKNQYADIEDYLYESYIREFASAKNFEDVFYNKLKFEGYVVGWRGREGEGIPMEVQFLAEGIGTSLNRFGNILKIVTVVNIKDSPKDGKWRQAEAEEGRDEIRIFDIPFRRVPGLSKDKDFFQRMDIIRDFILDKHKIEKGRVIALVGFYFEEGDTR